MIIVVCLIAVLLLFLVATGLVIVLVQRAPRLEEFEEDPPWMATERGDQELKSSSESTPTESAVMKCEISTREYWPTVAALAEASRK